MRPFSAAAPVLLSLAIPLPAQDEEKAREAFERAESLIGKGRYESGHKAYRFIADKYPNTSAGRAARERSRETAYLGWSYIEQNGPSDNRLDVVIMGDSFRLREQGRFDAWAKDIPKLFAKRTVLGEYRDYHNFVSAHLISKEGDVSGYGREYETALGAKIMGNNAPWVVVDRARVHAVLGQMPVQDGFALVLVKAKGMSGTGGGNIATVAGPDPVTIVHEWGHAFGGLGDEYTVYTHPRGNVRSAPNISNTGDPERVPWKHFIERKVPGIGVYRGGAGRLKGAWRPVTTNCLMHQGREFCRVCRERMVLRIHEFVDPIEGCEPEASPTRSQSRRVTRRQGLLPLRDRHHAPAPARPRRALVHRRCQRSPGPPGPRGRPSATARSAAS